ncbi:MAG: ATP-dependent protease LonB [Oscillospiraceae bacterium]|nr:ATP-dependent protease LonB [Oscillospiraceae bacterium]
MTLQFFFTAVVGLYFFSLLYSQRSGQNAISHESKKELEKLNALEKIKLTEPLSEKTRPKTLSDIIGQEDSVKALIAALCGPNPQHVLIYGPPGVGKTAAARLILERAKNTACSPFSQNAKFIETDATTLQFDERSIADPLIGSVHDPIYQGSGAYGNAGIPQPKPGAVSNAHGGILFIDEIGELHPIQINRLLKVLEDRRVKFESAYYASGDKNIPLHIHKIFRDGMPADFRLVGATTRNPDEIPPAIRSRCVEIYFNALDKSSVEKIAKNAAKNAGVDIEDGVCELISQYADNGRDAVSIIQTSISAAATEGRNKVLIKDTEWVLQVGKYQPKVFAKCAQTSKIGVVNGLSVSNLSTGYFIKIEATAQKNANGGKIVANGIIESEQINARGQKLIKKSMAKESVENATAALKNVFGINTDLYNIHINFPGGVPVDGPSAGIAIACAVYSAVKNVKMPSDIALTGEVSILGAVYAVGGVASKIEAAKNAGIKRVIIPKDNYRRCFEDLPIEIICVQSLEEVMDICFKKAENQAIYSGGEKLMIASASEAKKQ